MSLTTRFSLDEVLPTNTHNSVNSSAIFQNDVGPKIWQDFLPEALQSGRIVPKPDPIVVGEELRSVQLGLDKQKAGVSAAKVVVTGIS